MSSYDALPYTAAAFPPTHPVRIAAAARLRGVPAVTPATARVLEIGCGTGANLLAIAAALPRATCVGIDLSARQIAMGRDLGAAAGLRNVDLRVEGIEQFAARSDRFDYILCHGVYSHVPPPVAAAILALCARQLSPDGIAYVSYNTYPGWHQRAMVRQMLQFRVRGIAAPLERVQTARAYLDVLLTSLPESDGAYRAILESERGLLAKEPDTYVFHEHLEDDNHPVGVADMLARAEAVGLAYVGEAVADCAAALLPSAVRDAVGSFAAERAVREQHLDFLVNRSFRRSLFCRDTHRPVATEDPTACAELLVEGNLTLESPDPPSTTTLRITSPDGVGVTTDNPLAIALFTALAVRDAEPLAFSRLCDAAHREQGEISILARKTVGKLILEARAAGLVHLESPGLEWPESLPTRPATSPLARAQALAGQGVSTMRLRTLALDEAARRLVTLLDGRRDVPRLAAELGAPEAEVVFVLERFRRLGLIVTPA